MKREALNGALVKGTRVKLRGGGLAWGAAAGGCPVEVVTVIRGYRVGGELKYVVRHANGRESSMYELDLAV